MKTKRLALLSLGLIIITIGYFASGTLADSPLKSSNYEFDETSLGGLGLTDTQSANYQASESGGIIGFGNSKDSTMQINNGHTTTSSPALSFAVDNTSVSFGDFSATTTTIATSQFQVSDYTSYGYVVQSYGTSPTNNSGHTIAAMTSTGSSVPGTEQYGMNLVANTSPTSFGANPDHGQFGYGDPTANYDSVNNFRFVSGETIASAPESSGNTTYTISYIVNVSSITPGGVYTGNQTIICTGTY